MLRRTALLVATVLVCGCQNAGQPGMSGGPFGSSRVPPPGTNTYSKPPEIYYPGGSNPAAGPGKSGATGAVGAAGSTSAASTGFSPARIFTTQPQSGSLFADRSSTSLGNSSSSGVTPARFDEPNSRSLAPSVRFGDSTAPTARSAVRLNGMPVNDATKAPTARRVVPADQPPEITDLPRGTVSYGQPPAFAPYNPPGYPVSYAASLAPYPPSYAPVQTSAGSTTGSGQLGWKSKSPSSGASGTTFR